MLKGLSRNRFIPFIILAVFFLMALLAEVNDAQAKTRRRSTKSSCRAIIFSDSTKGKRLYGKNVDMKILPASTVKIMTALLVLEKLPLNKYITVRESALRVQPTIIGVKPGEQYRVKDLLYAILVNSANDASIVLAEAVAGSQAEFIRLMNRRAKQLGAKNTKFANSHGLPTAKGTQYTTAYDMYLIFRQALKHPFFRSAIRKKYLTVYSADGRARYLKNHNKILFMNWKQKVYGKTGYTRAAGPCFIGTIQKGSSQLIIGVFNCQNRWDKIKQIITRYGGVAL